MMERSKTNKKISGEDPVLPQDDVIQPSVVKKRKLITWRKLGASDYTTKDGQVVKSGETFQAYPEDIPLAFRDLIVPVTEI